MFCQRRNFLYLSTPQPATTWLPPPKKQRKEKKKYINKKHPFHACLKKDFLYWLEKPIFHAERKNSLYFTLYSLIFLLFVIFFISLTSLCLPSSKWFLYHSQMHSYFLFFSSSEKSWHFSQVFFFKPVFIFLIIFAW